MAYITAYEAYDAYEYEDRDVPDMSVYSALGLTIKFV
jgi:hypothetical protein